MTVNGSERLAMAPNYTPPVAKTKAESVNLLFMLALSIRQPYVELILRGIKTVAHLR